MSKDHQLEIKNMRAGYGDKVIIDNMSVVIPDHKISVFIGPNGCGKSTLLKIFARLIDPIKGERKLDGRDYSTYGAKELAQLIGLLPQSPIVPEGIKVSDLVARGRFPYQQPFRSIKKEDFAIVDEAMEMMRISELADKNVEELSGGQRQRVWIAMALAQQTDILFLDEPTTYLDIRYQIEILDLLKELNEKRKITIVMVLHDINLSARYADCLFALANKNLICYGKPKEILNQELMKEVFGLDCCIIEDPLYATPMVVPKGSHY